ncbi:MAG: hypothetical protein ACTHKU_15970, partial [Verrucomicrobiota bacterium]
MNTLTNGRKTGAQSCGIFFFCGWLSFAANSASGATLIVSNTNDSGSGSFRQAILDANSLAGTNTILFQIPGTGPFTLNPVSTYPSIAPNPVIIDGTSQPGYAGQPLIQINGANIGSGGDGLQLAAGYSQVRGLAVYQCKRDGIRIQGAGTNVIAASYLGTDASGTNSLGNSEAGIYLFQSSGNLIGGTTAAARNVISANLHGIAIENNSSASGNCIQGNYIGVNAAGTKRLGNLNNGIYLIGAPGNLIGGLLPGSGNLISGNGLSGIFLNGTAATGNAIQGNFIGTDFTGTFTISNRLDGVTISGAPGNTVGGTATGARNLISGNAGRGVWIGNSGASENVIQGNFIGTDVSGKIALANGTNGVAIVGVANNQIGGTIAAARNIISGNQRAGVLLIQTGATNNRLEGNFIGVDATGTNALPNAFGGVTVDGVAGNIIGGTATGAGNVISGNSFNGVYLVNAGGGSNVLQGN